MGWSWHKSLVASAGIAVGVVVGAPGAAQAESVSYTCDFVSPVFPGLQGPFAFAHGCEGPVGSHQNGRFTDAPPGAARFCSWVNATQIAGREGLDVTGRYCL
ncbi:hypothetical protein [Actinophytocola glycyrrhizae]|uniref:Secreted protein n=1 Tax=Actinophytocola glycyrrhizae TaxID=2044873 RepID=A0ABV9SCL2_9PSEU